MVTRVKGSIVGLAVGRGVGVAVGRGVDVGNAVGRGVGVGAGVGIPLGSNGSRAFVKIGRRVVLVRSTITRYLPVYLGLEFDTII